MDFFCSNNCVICNKEFAPSEHVVCTSGCAFPEDHRLWNFCDAPMHIKCVESWPDRVEFSEAYYFQRRQQYAREGFIILAESPNWFVGFIPPGPYLNQPDGCHDLIEIAIRDWPFALYGHTEKWNSFFVDGWREYQPSDTGPALERAKEVVQEIRAVLPNSETIVGKINKLLR